MSLPAPTHNSPWFTSVPDQLRWKPLHSTIRTDVTVIGGGMVGVLAAWNVAKTGRQVVLLEKNHVATGETGFSTAFLTRVPDVVSLADCAKTYGVGFLKELFAANKQAQQDLFSLIEKELIECDFQRCSSYFFSSSENDPILRKEWEAIKLVDPSAEWIGKEAGTIFPPAKAAVLFPDEGRFDIRKFLFGLLATEIGKRIRIFEDSPVVRLDINNTVHAKLEHGSVQSRSVIVATGSPAGLLPETQELLSPSETYVVLARFEERAGLADVLAWDTGRPYHYLRRVDEHTVMLGGEDHPIHEHHTAEKRFAALEQYLHDNLSGAFTLTHEWSGTLYDTSDKIPIVARHPHYPGQVVFATGFSGNGIVMGSLGGNIAARLALGENPEEAKLFSLERTGTRLPKRKVEQTKPSSNEKPSKSNASVRFLIMLTWFVLILFPGYVFFHHRGGFSFLSGLDVQQLSHAFFPLFGLYAFFFVWTQIMLGSNRDWLQKLFPEILRFHRAEGVFALLFALLHPILLFIGVGLVAYFAQTYVPQNLHLYIWLGYVQLTLLIITAGTALLMRTPLIRKYWRWIHFANYAVFISVWIHSWFLGTDVQSTSLRYLWYFFGITFLAALIGRIARGWSPRRHIEELGDAPEGFSTVGTVESFAPNTPHCVEVNGKKLVLVNVDGTFFALDNVCTHAGGPLCEGTPEDGTVIVCPLHASRFSMQTGEVLTGPATKPQPHYETRLIHGKVFIAAEPENTKL